MHLPSPSLDLQPSNPFQTHTPPVQQQQQQPTTSSHLQVRTELNTNLGEPAGPWRARKSSGPVHARSDSAATPGNEGQGAASGVLKSDSMNQDVDMKAALSSSPSTTPLRTVIHPLKEKMRRKEEAKHEKLIQAELLEQNRALKKRMDDEDEAEFARIMEEDLPNTLSFVPPPLYNPPPPTTQQSSTSIPHNRPTPAATNFTRVPFPSSRKATTQSSTPSTSSSQPSTASTSKPSPLSFSSSELEPTEGPMPEIVIDDSSDEESGDLVGKGKGRARHQDSDDDLIVMPPTAEQLARQRRQAILEKTFLVLQNETKKEKEEVQRKQQEDAKEEHIRRMERAWLKLESEHKKSGEEGLLLVDLEAHTTIEVTIRNLFLRPGEVGSLTEVSPIVKVSLFAFYPSSPPKQLDSITTRIKFTFQSRLHLSTLSSSLPRQQIHLQLPNFPPPSSIPSRLLLKVEVTRDSSTLLTSLPIALNAKLLPCCRRRIEFMTIDEPPKFSDSSSPEKDGISLMLDFDKPYGSLDSMLRDLELTDRGELEREIIYRPIRMGAKPNKSLAVGALKDVKGTSGQAGLPRSFVSKIPFLPGAIVEDETNQITEMNRIYTDLKIDLVPGLPRSTRLVIKASSAFASANPYPKSILSRETGCWEHYAKLVYKEKLRSDVCWYLRDLQSKNLLTDEGFVEILAKMDTAIEKVKLESRGSHGRRVGMR